MGGEQEPARCDKAELDKGSGGMMGETYIKSAEHRLEVDIDDALGVVFVDLEALDGTELDIVVSIHPRRK